MSKERLTLVGRDRKDLEHIACRLLRYVSEFDELDRDALAETLSKIMDEISIEDYQRLLGYTVHHSLIDVLKIWDEYGELQTVDGVLRTKKKHGLLYPILDFLSEMGLARLDTSSWILDPLVREIGTPVSDDFADMLLQQSSMYYSIKIPLDYWGAAYKSDLLRFLSEEDDDDDEFYRTPIADLAMDELILRNLGQRGLELRDGDLLLFSKEGMDCDELYEHLDDWLYMKLPYRITDEIKGFPMAWDPARTPSALTVYKALCPWKGMPEEPIEDEILARRICKKQMDRSARCERIAATLRRGAKSARAGKHKEAVQTIIDGLDWLPHFEERQEELFRVADDYVSACPQWILKGWSENEVRNMERITDQPFMQMCEISGHKVSSQSMCPCGSGKLFIHCHGRGQ